MKVFIVLLVVYCVIGSSVSITKEQKMEMFVKIANECATKEGASSVDVDELAAHKPASNQAGKCVRACLAETVGMMKNNILDMEGVINLASMAFDGNPARIQVAQNVANDCADITDSDRCEAAVKIMECCKKALKSRGQSFDEIANN